MSDPNLHIDTTRPMKLDAASQEFAHRAHHVQAALTEHSEKYIQRLINLIGSQEQHIKQGFAELGEKAGHALHEANSGMERMVQGLHASELASASINKDVGKNTGNKGSGVGGRS